MTKKSILLITPSKEFAQEVEVLLAAKWSDLYTILWVLDINSEIPNTDLALLDYQALDTKGADHLSNINDQLKPRPCIYLIESYLEDEKEFTTMKWMAADYLIKNNLTASSLHNTIRYALETSELKLQLKQQENTYSSLFYDAVEPAFFLDDKLTLTGVNDAFLEIFKIPQSQALKKSFLSFIYRDSDHNKLREKLAKLKKGNLNTKIHFHSAATKKVFLGHLSLSSIQESQLNEGQIVKKVSGYHGTFSNISHEQRLKAVKEQSEKIATTYKLARTMAHEIRNPLTNVNLALDQLREETAGRQDLNFYYEIIQRCTLRIDNILSQLLSSSEKQVFKKQTFDVVDLVKQVLEEIKDRSRLEEVELKTLIKIEHCLIEGDREKIKIAFTNLLTNALESLDKEQRLIECRVSSDGNYFCFEVQDNGLGIDQEHLDSLFDPFYTNKPNGVGIGLTSTRTIISEHDGEINVESKKNLGSTFSVYLPIAQ